MQMFKKGIVYQDFLAQEKNEKKEKQNIYKQILDVQVFMSNFIMKINYFQAKERTSKINIK